MVLRKMLDLVISPVKKRKVSRHVGSRNKSKDEKVKPKKLKAPSNDPMKRRKNRSLKVKSGMVMDVVSLGIPGDIPSV